MRRDLATVAKRVEKMRQHARRFIVPRLPLTCTGEWDDADARAYAEGDEATRDALESKYLGPLAPCLDMLGVRAIVVHVDPDWRVDEPDDDDEPVPEHIARIRERVLESARLAAEQAQRETLGYDPNERDPLDSNPEGDPNEVIYQHPQFGPVRRAEHQLRRQRAREEAQRRADEQRRIEESRMRTSSTYTAYDARRGQ